jgi:hypothetical protein
MSEADRSPATTLVPIAHVVVNKDAANSLALLGDLAGLLFIGLSLSVKPIASTETTCMNPRIAT